jgi:hypothetical protein
MARTDRTTEVDVAPRLTEARHELRIIRASCECRSYLAYCPCGGFLLEAGGLDFISWSYRKHIKNDPSVPAADA